MKKVRVMLAAVAVLAVVGGALAFKAKTAHTFYSLDPSRNVCDLPIQKFWNEDLNIGSLTPNYASHASPAPCSVKTIFAP